MIATHSPEAHGVTGSVTAVAEAAAVFQALPLDFSPSEVTAHLMGEPYNPAGRIICQRIATSDFRAYESGVVMLRHVVRDHHELVSYDPLQIVSHDGGRIRTFNVPTDRLTGEVNREQLESALTKLPDDWRVAAWATRIALRAWGLGVGSRQT